jgi:hypothetical protein
MKKTLAMVLVGVVLVGGAFFGGTKYGQSIKTANGYGQIGNAAGFGGRGGRNGANGGIVAGTILSKDANSITVQLRNFGGNGGSNNGTGSKIIFLGNSTEIGKTVSGTLNDLSVGQSVTVNGTTNSDGSVTAQTVQIRPNMPSPSPTK